ncbi:MAG TPA: Stp1/IreP family PP2C-type Ser/Thr phosphatase [Parafilimonas sp.]|nr:Stp1/IreP family PP2C-type Ser/Thr phosphatase [Parafilimonas sp.]
MSWFFRKNNRAPRLNSVNKACVGNMNAVMATHTGNVRTNNEDAAVICYPHAEGLFAEKGLLLLVADGMGGHNSGEVASALAIHNFKEAYFEHTGNILKSLKSAAQKANKVVFDTAQTNAAYNGMGTTLTAIAVANNSLYLAQVGDSRAYVFTKNAFKQLSKDQTLVQQLVDAGTITAESAATHPQKNILLNALGTKADMEASMLKLDESLDDNNLLLLCSDGLYDMVSEAEMLAAIEQTSDMDEILNLLITKALANGGSDNITILIAAKKTAFHMRASKDTEDVDISLMNENLQQ